MASPIDVNELFLKCMTESVTEKLTARTVTKYITSPFAIHCDKFAPEAEKELAYWKWCEKIYRDNSIWEEKIRFFYDFPELVEMRDFIRSNL